MTNLAAQTMVGLPPEAVYKTIFTELPDGTKLPQLFQLVRYPDGSEKWELTSERIRAFEESFGDTKTIPANWSAPDTEVLSRNDPITTSRETIDTVKLGGMTRIDLRRILILNLGDPQAIIRQKGLDSQRLARFEKDKAFFTTLCMMAHEHGGEWRKAREFLHPAYPDTGAT